MTWSKGSWINSPREKSFEDDKLTFETSENTDFWRKPLNGSARDSGHFFGMDAGSSFTAELRVQSTYKCLYDQAGIMVRIDEENWLKAGIEVLDGQMMLSSVLTVGKSDWATAVYQADASDFWLRVTIESGVVRLQISSDKKSWQLMRSAPFPFSENYLVGPMACTPKRGGLKVTFSDWKLSPPLN